MILEFGTSIISLPVILYLFDLKTCVARKWCKISKFLNKCSQHFRCRCGARRTTHKNLMAKPFVSCREFGPLVREICAYPTRGDCSRNHSASAKKERTLSKRNVQVSFIKLIVKCHETFPLILAKSLFSLCRAIMLRQPFFLYRH